ncbi:MAG: response regulator [Desulfovibrio sp.]|nr:response regulator [Desulfovibrio sp.]
MKGWLLIPFRYKMLLGLVLLVNLACLGTSLVIGSLFENNLFKEKGNCLLGLTRILDKDLGRGGFEEILARHNATHAPRAEQIRILNKALSEVSERVGLSRPHLGVGYYSKDLDAVLTYAPESKFAHTLGQSIDANHPGRTVMRENREIVEQGLMVRGNILNAMHPIERQGKVIGYIWANEAMEDVLAQLADLRGKRIYSLLLIMLLSMTALILLVRRSLESVDRIRDGVQAMRGNLGTRIGEVCGSFREVSRNINMLADDLQRTEAEKHRNQVILQTLMDNVPALVYVCEPVSKELVFANAAVCRFLGVQWENMHGKACHALMRKLDTVCPDCPINQDGVLPDGQENFEREAIVHGRMLLVNDRMVIWPDGRRLHLAVATDVTDRRALVQAEAAARSKSEFLAKMSHELRTPMNGVLGMTQLAMQADPPPAQLAYLKKIQGAASLLLDIINDVLDLAKVEAGRYILEKRVFCPRDMLEKLDALIRPRAEEKGLALHLCPDANVPALLTGDERCLSQVLLNLLGNAVKFTDTGSITLHMTVCTMTDRTLRLECTVHDTGIGINTEEQKSVFKPFVQAAASTARQFGGTGLGLTVCKELVALMGGTITLQSTPGKGSVFAFHVVMEEADVNAGSQGIPLMEEIRFDGLRILLAEDNLLNQEIAIGILEHMGCTVHISNNGQECLEAFCKGQYDLVLMDMRMPVMDGLEATRRIRAYGTPEGTAIPIVAMTADVMAEDRAACREAGMDGHLGKPINVDELRAVLAKVASRKGRLQQKQ